jgi:hypothetical protein
VRPWLSESEGGGGGGGRERVCVCVCCCPSSYSPSIHPEKMVAGKREVAEMDLCMCACVEKGQRMCRWVGGCLVLKGKLKCFMVLHHQVESQGSMHDASHSRIRKSSTRRTAHPTHTERTNNKNAHISIHTY